MGEEEVWCLRRLGCEQGAVPASLCSPGHRLCGGPGPRGRLRCEQGTDPASLCSPGHRLCGGPGPQRPLHLSWERTAVPRGILSELLRGRVHHKLTLFFLLTLDPLGGRENRTGRDRPAVLRGPRLWEWPPGPHPEQ